MDKTIYLYGVIGVISVACIWLIYKNYKLAHPEEKKVADKPKTG